MRRPSIRWSWFVLGLVALVVGLWLPGPVVVEAEVPKPVRVVNFPALQEVEGEVHVGQPIPHTRLLVKDSQVGPGRFENPNSYEDLGVIDVSGFSTVTLSLAGEIQGRLTHGGVIGALLVPEVPAIRDALRVHGVHQFTVQEQTVVSPSESGLFHSAQATAQLGFPRYRVFLFNETSRTATATLYLYLGQ